MYIQITTYCNMSCAHCSYSCEAGKKGEHMSLSLFREVLTYCNSYGENVVLGGGEPTIHPQFWTFFGEAMAAENVENVWMATNGSITKITLALAEIAAGGGKFSIALSQDSYHDPIDWKVREKFDRLKLEIRNVDLWGLINKGAALANGIGSVEACACPETMVAPDGKVTMCGCPDSFVLGYLWELEYEVINRAKELADTLKEGCGASLTEEQKDFVLNGVLDLEDVA